MSSRFSLAGTMIAVAASAALSPGTICAQDIQAAARMQGIELPEAYYQRITLDPSAFEFQRALFRRAAI